MDQQIVTPVQIIQTPDVLGGQPRIEGRRISVAHVIGHVIGQGWDFDQMQEAFGLRPAEIHAALAYYYDHRDEINTLLSHADADWQDVDAFEEQLDVMDGLLTTADAASVLGVSERRIRALIQDGRIRAQKLGRQWLIHPDELERPEVQERRPGRPPGSG